MVGLLLGARITRGGKQMLVVFAGSWWAMVLRGIAGIVFGVLAFMWPHITLTVLVFLFGAYALVDGAFSIVAGIKSYGEYKRWWLLLIEGVLSVLAGAFAFFVPAMTALILLILIASWAIVTGILEIAAAIQLRKVITGEWLLALSGVLSVLFGALLLYNPVRGALAVVWLIGAYSIVFGILLIAFGIKLRALERSAPRMVAHPV
jgi:uncharacterized membrane protein HdeD (DUF308 family)